MNDRELVLKTLSGDKEAYGLLIEAYQGMVFAQALNITGNYSDSQDIVQETFLRAYQKLRKLSNPAKFARWLHSITKRIALDFLRKKNSTSALIDSEAPIDQIRSSRESAAEAFAQKEISKILWSKINALPSKTREAILLYYMEDFSIKRAAAFLGISQTAMKSRLDFGREKLRHSLMERVADELRQNQPAKKNRNFILAALPAGGVPKIGLLGSLAAKGALTMAAISAKKAAIIAAAVVIGTITTITIINRAPKPGPVVQPVIKTMDVEVTKPAKTADVSEKTHANEEPLDITQIKDELPEQVPVEVGASRTLLVIVTDEDSRPLQGVHILVLCQSLHRSNWSGRTEYDGKYKVLDLDLEATKFKAYFTHPKYVDIEIPIEFEEDEFEKVLNMELERGLSISGYVTDSDSEPIQGANIEVSRYNTTIPSPQTVIISKTALSDDEGYFEVIGISAGRWTLEGRKYGYAPEKLTGVVVGEENVTDIELVLSEGHSISGTMFLGDNPISNQEVRFYIRVGSRWFTTRNASTDQEGHFTISDLKNGTYTIEASIEDMPMTGEGTNINLRKEVHNVATGTEDLVIQFGGLGSISGIVKNAGTLVPVTDFEVTYQRDYKKNKTEVTETYNGVFSIGNIQAGKYKLEVTATGYSVRIIENIVVQPGETTSGIEVLLEMGAQITGRVILGDSGKPIKDAKIRIEGKKRYRGDASTDEDGVFIFTSLAPDQTYTLKIRYSDRPSKKIESVKVIEGQTRYLDDIVLDTGGIIEGRVTDAQGNGIIGATVYASAPGFYPKWAVSDEDGYYKSSGVNLGEVTVRCRLDEGSTLRKTVNIVEGIPITVDFAFGSGCTISGTVTDNGNPITKARVQLFALSKGQISQSSGRALLKDSNEFKLKDIKPGKYVLSIVEIDDMGNVSYTYQHKQNITVGQEDLTLNIKTDNSTVKGRVVDAQGKPVDIRMIMLEPWYIETDIGDVSTGRWEVKYFFASVDNEGKFSLGSITPGRYTVGTNAARFKVVFQPIADIIVKEGQNIENLELRIPESSSK